MMGYFCIGEKVKRVYPAGSVFPVVHRRLRHLSVCNAGVMKSYQTEELRYDRASLPAT